MMIFTKFAIGQQVRHKMSGLLGVIIDVDPEYSLTTPKLEEFGVSESLRTDPWYHVIIENYSGEAVYTYVAEVQLYGEVLCEHLDQPSLDELASSIRQQLQEPCLRH